jgi:hypothetical protein
MQAQTTGTLAGKVTGEDGKAVPGATIKVLGTTPLRGAVAKTDGSYLIAGIRAGEYDVQVSAVGYKSEIRPKVRISIDQETHIDFRIGQGSKTADTLVVVARRTPPINIGSTTKTQSISGEDIQRSARTSIQSAMALNSGVTTAGVNGISIRGGRASETSIRVDGVKTGDPFTGGFGSTSAGYYPTVSTLAVSEVQVISSGFGPEYGDVLSGVVNSVTRTGRPDRYEGVFRFRTNVPALYGSSSPITVKKAGTDIDTTLPGAKLLGSGSQIYEFGFGGPIPGLDRSTFYITGKYNPIDHNNSGYEVYDMSEEFARQRAPIAQQVWGYSLTPSNLGALPHGQALIRDFNGKFKFGLTDDIFVEVGGEVGLTSLEIGEWTNIYQLDKSTVNGVVERDAQQDNQNTIINRANVHYFQSLDATSFFEVTGSWVHHKTQTGKKDETKKYGIFDTYDIYEPVDANHDVVIDRYANPETEISLNPYLTEKIQSYARNPITGLYEGGEVTGASHNPYGLIGGDFPVHGNSRNLETRDATVLELKGNYETNFNIGDVKTQVKSGFEFSRSTLRRHENSLPWEPNPFFDVYGYESDYFNLDTTGTLKNFFAEPYNPIQGALYLGTRFDYKSIVFYSGVRFDFLNPNTKMPPAQRNTIAQVVKSLQTGGDATLKFQVSPRIGVSYPVTDQSQFRVNFAVMFKMPDLNYLYDNAYGESQRGNQIFGNPDIDPQKVFVYDLGYETQIADNYTFEVTAFYRDIYNQTGVTYVPVLPSPYVLYTVTEYGNVRGLELSARRLLTDNIGAEINYTLQKAVGTASSPDANYALVISGADPYTGEIQKFPLTEYPLNYDQTHSLNATLSFVWGEGEGPAIGGLRLLQNTDITLTATYGTGLPYTREDTKGNPITEYNSQRLPSQFTTEAHIERGFKLRDLLGESVGNLEVSFFADVYNLLNTTSANGVRLSRVSGGSRYSITGSPDNDGQGLNRQVGDFSAIPAYRDIDPARPETWSVSQYDRYGTRYYNPYVDANLDGVVTQDERFEGYQRFIATIQTLRGYYQTPRTVAVGVKVQF